MPFLLNSFLLKCLWIYEQHVFLIWSIHLLLGRLLPWLGWVYGEQELDLAQDSWLSTCRPALVLALTLQLQHWCLSHSLSQPLLPGAERQVQACSEHWYGRKAVPGDQQHRGWNSGPDPAAGVTLRSPPSKQGHQRQQQPMAGGHWSTWRTSEAHRPLGKPPSESQWGDTGALVGGSLALCRSRMGMNTGEHGGLGDIVSLVWCMRCQKEKLSYVATSVSSTYYVVRKARTHEDSALGTLWSHWV